MGGTLFSCNETEPPMTILGFLYNHMSIIVIAVQNFQVSVVGLDFSFKDCCSKRPKNDSECFTNFPFHICFLDVDWLHVIKKVCSLFPGLCSSKPIFLFSSSALVNSNNHSSWLFFSLFKNFTNGWG